MADVIEDEDGRKLTVREMPIREKMAVTRQFGAASDVQTWYGQVMLAACVTEIDGIPVAVPRTPEQADALVERVGTAGADAIVKWYLAKKEADAAIRKDRAKNSAGTLTS